MKPDTYVRNKQIQLPFRVGLNQYRHRDSLTLTTLTIQTLTNISI